MHTRHEVALQLMLRGIVDEVEEDSADPGLMLCGERMSCHHFRISFRAQKKYRGGVAPCVSSNTSECMILEKIKYKRMNHVRLETVGVRRRWI